MSTQHTPGPWSTARGVIIRSQGREIATAWGVTVGTAQANARLIAAAPDMLEALQSCAARFDEYADHHGTNGDEKKSISNRMMANMCLDVIAKATGGAA